MKLVLRVLGGLTLGVLVSCRGGGDPVAEGREALASGKYGEAVRVASDRLANESKTSPKVQWALERIRLEGLAKNKQGDEAFRALESLVRKYPAQVDAALYLTVGEWARGAGDSIGAMEIFDAGKRRFPQEAEEFVAAIEEIKKAGADMDPATIERLRSLGYLD